MRAFLVILAAVFLTGCAGYKLGPTNGVIAGSRSIKVMIFQNDTAEPRLSEAVATSLRRMIQNDGTYKLSTGDDASYILSGKITEFNRSSLSFDPRDVLTTRDYTLRINASFVLSEPSTGRVITNSATYGRTLVRGLTDLSSAERQAIPLLAEDLARNITSQVVEGTW